jgi:hypothetical protein
VDPRDALNQLTDAIGRVSPEVVACGIVVGCWRDAMEPFHRFLADHEMAYINIATTRAVADFCTPDSVNWGGVRRTLLNHDRVILPGRTAREVTGDGWGALSETVRENLDDAQQRSAILHAGWALMVCSNWWGTPGYAEQVAGLLETGRVTRWQGTNGELGEALLTDPLSVPLEVWEEIIGGNGLGWLDRE